MGKRTRPKRRRPRFLRGAMFGGALGYLFDPDMGARRRAMLRDKTIHLFRTTERTAEATAHDVRNRSKGLVAKTRARMTPEQVDDRVLEERVRARIGGVVRHPRSIEVRADDGVVTVGGPILAHEVDRLLRRVMGTRGVTNVRSMLQPHDDPEGVPGLQGEGTSPRREVWSPTGRLAAGAGGAVLTMSGLRRGGLMGIARTGSGLALLGRAVTNRPISRVTGIGAGRNAIDIKKTITIARPIEQVFDFWSRYENFPRFMSHVREVRMTGEGRSHWVVDGPAGSTVEWDAVETKRVPNDVIAWRSEPGSLVQHAGMVRFEREGEGTRISVQLSYNPLAGAVAHAVASVLGADPKKQMNDDLMRVKTELETGERAPDVASKS